jgi:tetratricopeptide (TPR) repeat protein
MSSKRQRIEELNKAASDQIFTNTHEALKLLSESYILLKEIKDPDLELQYYLHSALIENLLYNYKLSEKHFRKAIALVDERGDISQLAETYLDFIGTLINLDKLDEARNLLVETDGLLKAFPLEKLHPRYHCRQGYLYLRTSNYTKALESFIEGEAKIQLLTATLDLKDFYFITLMQSGLGNIYTHNHELDKSIKSFREVVKLCEEKGMRSRLSWHYLNVGNSYLALGDIDNAIEFFKNAIRVIDDVNQEARALAYANLGYCYLNKGLWKKSLTLMNNAYPLFKDKKEKNLANIEWWRAKIFDAQGKRRKALSHYYIALELSQKGEDLRQLSSIIKEISEWHARERDFKNAYDFQLLYENALERYFREVRASEIRELEVKYEAEKKEKEAEMFRLQATGLQLKALRAQMNPHFMFNALNSIQGYITSNSPTLASRYLSQFANLMRQSLDYSELEVISLENEIEFLQNYLELNQKLRFEHKLNYILNIDEEIEEDICGVPTMIIQPYVENAIEHGIKPKRSGLITIDFQLEDEDTILCIVQDDGVGREKARKIQESDPQTKQHKSMGTKITQDRLKILLRNNPHSENPVVIEDLINEDSGEPTGTKVKIYIPIADIQKK